MTSSAFEKLRAASSDSVDRLRKQLEELNTNAKSVVNDDAELFWSLTIDKAGNGTAIIRFLPAPEGETSNFVRVFNHAFQGPTGLWYIENSLTTIGKADPVSEYNRELWNSGEDFKKEQVRKQKRKMAVYANILVIKDPAKPENDGKVFYYRFGKQVLDKIIDASTARDELDDRVLYDPFDLWTGANFRLRAKTQDKWLSFNSSDFDKQTKLFEDDAAMENVWKQCRSLYKFIDPEDTKRYKSYEQLKSQLLRVTGAQRPTTVQSEPEAEQQLDADDEDLEYFKKLAEG